MDFTIEANIMVTGQHSVVNQWIKKNIYQEDTDFVGFDTESNPHRNWEVCLIQICTVDEKFNIPRVLLWCCPNCHDIPSALRCVLEDENILKCGVGLGGDIRLMKNRFRVNFRGAFDVMEFTDKGLKKSVSEIVGVEIPPYKDICISKWYQKHLEKRQIMYGALDAIYGHFVMEKILEETGSYGKLLDIVEEKKERRELEKIERKREKRRRQRAKQREKLKKQKERSETYSQ